MERTKHYLTPEMKAEIQKKKDIAIIYEKTKVRNDSKRIFRTAPKPSQVKFVLPEEFTGRDLKRAKKLIKKRK